jgi:membrane-associated protein
LLARSDFASVTVPRFAPMFHFLHNLYDPAHLQALAKAGGIPVLAAIVFAETGLLVGFFLPGDTMLFVAGVASALAHGAYLNIYALTVTLIVAAVAGDQLGYFLGYQTGHAIFTRPDGFFFKKKHAVRAHEFYTKYGTAAIIAARFMPVLRTFVREMRYLKFLLVDSIGGIAWITIVLWAGYILGERAQHQLHYIVLGIALVSMLPVIIGVGKEVLAGLRKKA